MRYIAIDIETTGLEFNSQVLEVAMVREDTESLLPLNQLPCARFLFNYPRFIGSEYALKLHEKSGLLDECTAHGNPYPSMEWHNIKEWLGFPEVGHKHIAAGKNIAGFDLQFFPKQVKELFHHRVIDPGSVLIDWKLPCVLSLGELKERCGFGDSVSHRALDDALDVIRVLRSSYKRW